ncbi:MAG: DUF4328 domain-containing protein [Acidimicrobiales bacterium]
MAGTPPLPRGGYAGPSGRYAYGAYPPTQPFRPFGGLATAATVLLGVMAVVALFGLGAHLNRVGLIERELREGGVSFGELEEADDLVGGAAVMYGLGLLATAAVFITWQHRHAVNADALVGAPAALGPAWAIGGWFVPFANWLLPGMQLFGASRAADPALPLGPAAGRGRGSPLVILWAVMFGLGTALGLAGWATFPDEDELAALADLGAYVSDARLADRMVAAGFVINAAAAIIAAVMVRTLSRQQEERATALASAAIGWRSG